MSAYEDTKREREAWLAALAAGDRVAVARGYRGDDYYLALVDHRTPAGWLVVRFQGGESHYLFDKDGAQRGLRGGGSFDRWSIVPVTPAVEEQLERRRFVSRIAYYIEWNRLPIETVRAIGAALDAASSGVKPQPDYP